MQSISEMTDSVEWQRIFELGRSRGKAEVKAERIAEGMRSLILHMGTGWFGAPSDAILRKIQSIQQEDELTRLGLRLLDVSNWDELFAD